MLVDLQRDLDPGDTVPITVQFERSGPIQLTAEVVTQRTSA
jgi:copper(I)-binding protein